jgi:protoheme IX farnesyltransferase
MKTATPAAALPLTRSRFADYLELTKPRIAVMVLFTVAAGYWLACRGTANVGLLLHTVCATGLVAAGASALNQLLERHCDARMRRTANRPLPAGRLQPREGLLFGLALGFVGLIYLALAVRQPLAVLVAAATFVCYVGVYTPLKRKTTLNTLIGAVPGALPPVIGWTAAGGPAAPELGVLFLVLFLWQVPHFLAIAWIYRDDYARAGLRMLPVVDPRGTQTARQMVGFCLLLLLVSLAPVLLGGAGLVYLVGAAVLGMSFLGATLLFTRDRSARHARGVLRASLVYLPLLLALLLLDGVSGPMTLAR